MTTYFSIKPFCFKIIFSVSLILLGMAFSPSSHATTTDPTSPSLAGTQLAWFYPSSNYWRGYYRPGSYSPGYSTRTWRGVGGGCRVRCWTRPNGLHQCWRRCW